MFKEMLSESSSSSCMRFCVVLIVGTMCLNWILRSIGVLCNLIDTAVVSPTEIAAIIGALGIKMGQKKFEKKE